MRSEREQSSLKFTLHDWITAIPIVDKSTIPLRLLTTLCDVGQSDSRFPISTLDDLENRGEPLTLEAEKLSPTWDADGERRCGVLAHTIILATSMGKSIPLDDSEKI